MVFKPDGSDLRFAECKRADTRDRINRRQALGLSMLSALVRAPVDLFVVAPRGTSPRLDPIRIAWQPTSELG
jgi:hypothetical protein